MLPETRLLLSRWTDYNLLDSGGGQKLERFGRHTFIRPEVQAMWQRALPDRDWLAAEACFNPTGEESGGHWDYKKKIAEKWEMTYDLEPGTATDRHVIRFWAQTTGGRHLGVFPECASHWDWIHAQITSRRDRQVNVLNLFGYTGLATLAAAAAGAKVTHLDASRKSVDWARQNQVLSGLLDAPVRWIVDDAVRFVQREARRGVKYDGIVLDPPKFGRGPKGEVWEVFRSLPVLLQACRQVLNENPLFVVLTVYAVKASPVHLRCLLEELMKGSGGFLGCGELVTREASAGRLLSQAVYARWAGTSPVRDKE